MSYLGFRLTELGFITGKDKLKAVETAKIPERKAFRWYLEEFRVSLFAQQLKTPYPVSAKRLDKAWDEK